MKTITYRFTSKKELVEFIKKEKLKKGWVILCKQEDK